MKKMVLGVLLSLIGLVFSAFCFMYAVMNPGVSNGIDGLLGAFLCADTLLPFVISLAVMCVGVAICFWEAFRKAK